MKMQAVLVLLPESEVKQLKFSEHSYHVTMKWAGNNEVDRDAVNQAVSLVQLWEANETHVKIMQGLSESAADAHRS
jgi:hypothetical protein